MAKRGTLTHRRTRRLAAALRISPPHALGLMEALWHVTAENAPRGDIGRLANQDLADEIYWDGEADELIAAFVRAGVLEEHGEFRLAVHGWSEHADNATRHKLARARVCFWDGQPPFKGRPSKEDDNAPAAEHGQSATDHAVSASDHDESRSDEIDPIQCPATSDQRPVTSDQQPATSATTDTPPSPPAGAGGRRPTSLHVGDRHPATGGEVLEVADGVPIVGKARRSAYAVEAKALADYAMAKRLPGDRAAERTFRELLRGGRSPEEIRASLDRAAKERDEREAAARPLTPEELEAAERSRREYFARREAAAAPPAPAEPAAGDPVDPDEAAALRLLGPPASPRPSVIAQPSVLAPAYMPSSTVSIVHRGDA